MENYIKGPALGTGTFGDVFMATHKATGQVVAIKRIRVTEPKEGVNVTALREIKILRELTGHPNIIGLIDAFPQKKAILLVFEFMVSDLEKVIKTTSVVLSTADIKSYMQMILRGLAACHQRWVIHRDMKPNNCLISPTGDLKLADFGLSRLLLSPERGRPYTNQVFARWYRAPELLFGSTCYGFAPDVWGAGCVFAELLLRRPWFPGTSDLDQLGKVFQALGTPTQEAWPGVTQLPNYLEYHKVVAPPLKALFPKAADDALDLLSKMVCLNPSRRITAEKALAHRYFSNDPQPTPPERLPRPAPNESAPLNESTLPTISITRPSNYPGDAAVAAMQAVSVAGQQQAAAAAAQGGGKGGGVSRAQGASSPQPRVAGAESPGSRPAKRLQLDRP